MFRAWVLPDFGKGFKKDDMLIAAVNGQGSIALWWHFLQTPPDAGQTCRGREPRLIAYVQIYRIILDRVQTLDLRDFLMRHSSTQATNLF